MVKKSDIGGKRLIGLSPQAWGRWVTGDKTIKVQEIINSELQWIERESDVLLKYPFSTTNDEVGHDSIT